MMFLDDDVISRWDDVRILEQPPSWICHVGVFYFPRTSKGLRISQPFNKPPNRDKSLQLREIIKNLLTFPLSRVFSTSALYQ